MSQLHRRGTDVGLNLTPRQFMHLQSEIGLGMRVPQVRNTEYS
jgi:hypothetical protein